MISLFVLGFAHNTQYVTNITNMDNTIYKISINFN